MPRLMTVMGGRNHFYWSEGEQLESLKKEGVEFDPISTEAFLTTGQGERIAVPTHELSEARELEKLFEKLDGLDVPIEDYALRQEESVSGQKLATRYALETVTGASKPKKGADDEEEGGLDSGLSVSSDGKMMDVPSVAEILDGVHEIGRRGLDIKRFKGLGEMDADQLWETTMNPERRTLMRVALDAASEAETLFSVLMGENVEQRRKFIEEHALEVKNLDV